jgi:TonB family protein
MKTSIVIACLVALLCGCSSTQSRSSIKGGSDYAQSTGSRASAWGDLPTYAQLGPPSFGSAVRAGPDLRLEGSVTVDLLVERDGSVRDVSIVKSSGDPAVDQAAKGRARGMRFNAKIHPNDPAPYLVPSFVVRFDPGAPGQSPIYRHEG